MAEYVFHKMHGLGNDFVIFDGRENPVQLNGTQIRQLSDRKRGIGCDQLIIIAASENADIAMRIYNNDGGEVEACGNATRCVAALIGQEKTSIETAAGILQARLCDNVVSVAMGKPLFDWASIPISDAMDTADMPVGWGPLERPFAVNIGNPHAIFFVEDQAAINLHELGPVIENDPLFPERINVNVATVKEGAIDLRVWERGAGLTEACGTGACATAIAAIAKGLCASPITVNLPGGSLSIAWQSDSDVVMTGPFTHVFTGKVSL
jgi:diaminopimelate epimerase